MYVEEWHIFWFEKLWHITQREAKTSVWSYAIDTSARPLSEPDQSILSEQWVFVFAILWRGGGGGSVMTLKIWG
jgi:hypothetical protein